MVEIEKGHPMPDAHRGPSIKYPHAEMVVGDSFLAPGRTAAQMASLNNAWAKKLGNGARFIARTVPGGARVWRVS